MLLIQTFHSEGPGVELQAGVTTDPGFYAEVSGLGPTSARPKQAKGSGHFFNFGGDAGSDTSGNTGGEASRTGKKDDDSNWP